MYTDHKLASRLERTEGSAGAAFVAARGGTSTWVEIGGAYTMFDGIDSPLTQTFGLGMLEAATSEILKQVEDFFQTRNAPVQHEICPLAGVPLMRAMTERGYSPIEVSSVLYRELDGLKKCETGAGEMNVRAAGPADADAYAQAAGKGWQEAGELSALITGMTQIMFAATGYTGFIVEKRGQIIATAGLVIHDGVALLAGASTIPEARGQGAQRAVLAARLDYATSCGCDLAMFVAEPGGASQRNAERSGFRIAYTRTKWRLEATSSAKGTTNAAKRA